MRDGYTILYIVYVGICTWHTRKPVKNVGWSSNNLQQQREREGEREKDRRVVLSEQRERVKSKGINVRMEWDVQ